MHPSGLFPVLDTTVGVVMLWLDRDSQNMEPHVGRGDVG
jgi:hypothetical protein